jgi:putative ABC transport system substrate-binding protein
LPARLPLGRWRHERSQEVARIGVLWHAGSAEEEAVFLRPLVEGIANTKLGYVEGQNVTFGHRFPAEQPERFTTRATTAFPQLQNSGPAARHVLGGCFKS